MDVKVCNRCGKSKPLSEFYISKSRYSSQCKDCICEKQRKRRALNKRDDTELRRVLKEAILKDFSNSTGSRYAIRTKYIYLSCKKEIGRLNYDRISASQKISKIAKENGFIKEGKTNWIMPDGFDMEMFSDGN